MPIKIRSESFAAFKIRMFFNETELSEGTGFFWKGHSRLFAVTNWHNISGRNARTLKHLSKTLAEPNRATLIFYQKANEWAEQRELEIEWPSSGKTNWIQHSLGRKVDVIALDITDAIPQSKSSITTINRGNDPDFLLQVAEEVYILGFPLGLHLKELPIWKRGTIATEPDLNYDEDPMFLIDTASNKGMSGSPVISIKSSGPSRSGNMVISSRESTRFLGVYSGRIAPNGELDAQLGMVWKEHVIDEIVLKGKFFDHSEVS